MCFSVMRAENYYKMNRIIRIFAVVALLSAGSLTSNSQCLWTDFNLNSKIAGNFSGTFRADYRTTNGLKATDQWRLTFGVNYKILPWLKAGASYTFIDKHFDGKRQSNGDWVPAYWQPRNRVNVDLTGSWCVAHFTIALRERYEYTHNEATNVDCYTAPDNDFEFRHINAKHTNILRSRLKIDYDIKKSPVDPYIFVEIYNSLDNDFRKDKIRYTAGANYKINKKNSVSLYYSYFDQQGVPVYKSHIIGASYTLTLR